MATPQYQLPQLPPEPHIVLVRCEAKYLGYAAPADVSDGLEAVQKPLIELTCGLGVIGPPYESVLTSYTSGVLLEAPSTPRRPTINQWWPISDLLECGAFRWDGNRFQPVRHYVPSHANGGQPTVFSMTFRRRDIPVNDCWVFFTRTEQAAVAMVTALKLAHMNRLGWGSSPNDRPHEASSCISTSQFTCVQQNCGAAPQGSSMFQASGGRGIQGASWKTTGDFDGGTFINSSLGNFSRIYNEFFEKPPLQGYFYTPSSSLIQTYSISSGNNECNVVQKTTEPLFSALPLISGPHRPDFSQLDRNNGSSSKVVQADVVRPTASWPLVHDLPPQPQPQLYPQYQQQQAQPVAMPVGPLPEATIVTPMFYPEYFPGYLPQHVPSAQPVKTVEFVKEVVTKKKHRKHHDHDDDDDDDASSVSSVGINGKRYVLVPEEALRGKDRRQPLREVPTGQLVYPPDFGPIPLARNDYLQPANFPQYESHIAQGIPAAAPSDFYREVPPLMADPYVDEGPYERRLPAGGPQMAGNMIARPVMMVDDPAYDPDMMYGSNFILRPSNEMMRRV